MNSLEKQDWKENKSRYLTDEFTLLKLVKIKSDTGFSDRGFFFNIESYIGSAQHGMALGSAGF